MLEISDLKAGYGSVDILYGIDMRVAEGEIVAVLGSNGVGKTTLNNTISGLIRARAGSILFNGSEISHCSSAEIVGLGIAHVPEGRRVFPDLTVEENLEVGAYRRAGANKRRNIERMFQAFPRLKERRSQAAGTLSGGEQQMLAIARGLMSEPRLLILDEPSLGLSPVMVEEMFSLIRRINAEGLSIMLVEQNVVQSLEVASRTYVLEQGRFAISGSSQEVMANPELRRTYLGM
ncbi:ABC transporter ATP-binding protein [Pusillimonas noertemannii]|uniref:Amino acid/amide ABC transporter ATP-binding protein 2 (HAAT family) n=1 Tax=Pusillimonas noertemannii TaxID=305977 RepID=A0A2U1CN25_9BURK|nr:ABC transporter ATP-binding protein [Pusillimonas noertemannii]NYT68581.1 ABC transporter ATP-binding protein [Pusillimonas noertemannii]PVY62402.1 amino acid/amide ABC transporter ATP-binding protein 2 (HAAT family) [Pusillimonas noertemannii]TFL10634.1 ABC transporter ATP-binding protein [Pusillimonas noertemannii]